MITLRTLTIKDIPEALTLSRYASWNQLEHDWQTILEINPEGSLAAVKENHVVGTASTIRYSIGFSFIGMVLVHPQHQKQGIGKMLLDAAMELLKNEKIIKLDATAQGRELYLKLGFKDECSLSRLVYSGASPETEDNNIIRLNDDCLDGIIDMDAAAFDGDRYIMLKNILRRNGGFAYVAKGDDRLKGYCLGRKGYHMNQVGPLIAEDQATAQMLINNFLSKCNDRPVAIDVFEDNKDWKKWLIKIGFKEQRSFIRMVFGENNFKGDISRQFAITGPEFG